MVSYMRLGPLLGCWMLHIGQQRYRFEIIMADNWHPFHGLQYIHQSIYLNCTNVPCLHGAVQSTHTTSGAENPTPTPPQGHWRTLQLLPCCVHCTHEEKRAIDLHTSLNGQHNRSVHRRHATERLPCMAVFYDTHTWGGVNCMPNFCRQVQWGSSLSNLTHWEGGTGPIFKTFRHPVFTIRAACKTVSWGTWPKSAKQAVPHQCALHTNTTSTTYIFYIFYISISLYTCNFHVITFTISTNPPMFV